MTTTDHKALIAILASVEAEARLAINVPTGCVIVSLSYCPEFTGALDLTITHFPPLVSNVCTQGRGPTAGVAIFNLITNLSNLSCAPSTPSSSPSTSLLAASTSTFTPSLDAEQNTTHGE